MDAIYGSEDGSGGGVVRSCGFLRIQGKECLFLEHGIGWDALCRGEFGRGEQCSKTSVPLFACMVEDTSCCSIPGDDDISSGGVRSVGRFV